MIQAMHPDEALTIARIRQWSADRLALASAKHTNYQREGWQQRDNRTFDARQVRVIDFCRALAHLDPDEQAALILRYRDREPEPRIALALRCSTRRVSYLIPAARKRLASILMRLDLL
ncbi:MAG TPA: sigma factor-like helix-turn-helix DNA-binding protein [Terracidiphilus sp.]|nr:sigma factor-like helix-turn-helix DNA-binding protein [Terracidiphilus sp.]